MNNAVGPVLFRGALVALVDGQMTTIVAFQYNPETITRTLTPSLTGSGEDDRSSELRYRDAPGQTIAFTAYFDAADALQVGDATTKQLGIGPQLALLEGLIYPARSAIEARDNERNAGKLQIAPITAARTLLVWGDQRVVPVRISALTVTEEAFDTGLNPIRANAQITLAVQTYGDRVPTDDDYQRFGAYHSNLEKLAARANAPSQGDRARLNTLLNR